MSATNPRVFFSLLAGVIFLGLLVALAVATELPWIAITAISLSVTGFASMGFDKSLSRSQSTRIPEVVLFAIALLGGSPGVFLGIHFFRHKTKKPYFQFVLLLIFCVQLYIARLFEISFM